jgi:TPR repeat protein
VESDIKMAILWYERAASSGDQKAAEKLIALIANPTLIDGLFSHGYVAPAA